MNSFLLILLCLFLFNGCTTSRPPSTGETPNGNNEPTINYEALRQELNIQREEGELGYLERTFNTCHVKSTYTGARGCQQVYYIDIRFRLQCRNSEGTVSTQLTQDDLKAISAQTVRWNLKGLSSELQTTADGYGHIEALSPVSQQNQRLKLAVGNDFLYLRAKEITRVITPRSWCHW